MSSSGVTSSTVNGVTRVTGLTSGLDVDSIVKQLVTAEKAKKLNKLQQKEQLAEWRQTSYQTVTSEINAFADKYFSSTASTSLLSAKNFTKYTVTSSDSAVAATYTSAASAGTHRVFVSQLATAATRSTSGLAQNIKSGAAVDFSVVDLSDTGMVITVDGTEYTCDTSEVTSLATLQTAIDDAAGSGKLTVSQDSSGYLTITAADSGVQTITLSAPETGTSALAALGFTASGAVTANRLDTSTATVADVANYLGFGFNTSTDADGNTIETLNFTINGVSLSIDSTETVAEMIDDISDADCGATLAYDQTTGELVFTAAATGAGSLLNIGETVNAATARSDADGTTDTETVGFLSKTTATGGKDAKMTVDGVAYTRSSNTVTLNGVTYTLNAVTDADADGTADSGETATVSLTLDTDGIYDLVSNFVTDYNSLIATLNDLVDENYDTDYPPLTDDQKEDMTDEEITKWETKAKTGILEDDSLIKSFLSELRSSLTDSISGVSSSIFSIGINTGDYADNGKLEIDEDALKEAITADPQAIVAMFTQQATSVSGSTGTVRTLSSGQLATRYKEEGIAYRFYDIITEYTSTIKDSNGYRGKLVEKAGLTDSNIASDNELSEKIDDYNEQIAAEEDRLDDYEDKLYSKYSTLETYINNMNTQLTALSSYLNNSTSSS